MMDWAAFTNRCNFLQTWAEQLPYHVAMHPNRMLSLIHLKRLIRVVPYFLGLFKKLQCWCAFLTMAVVGQVQIVGDVLHLNTADADSLADIEEEVFALTPCH